MYRIEFKMKEILSSENLEKFRRRFGSLHDAVIHEATIGLFSKTAPAMAQIVVGAQDFLDENNVHWVNIIFEVDNVTKFHFQQERNSLVSIVYQLGIAFYNDEVCLNFNSLSGDLVIPDDFEKKRFGDTEFIIIGKKVFWEVVPYQER